MYSQVTGLAVVNKFVIVLELEKLFSNFIIIWPSFLLSLVIAVFNFGEGNLPRPPRFPLVRR